MVVKHVYLSYAMWSTLLLVPKHLKMISSTLLCLIEYIGTFPQGFWLFSGGIDVCLLVIKEIESHTNFNSLFHVTQLLVAHRTFAVRY